MKKILLIMLVGIFFVSFVGAAQESLPDPIEQYSCFDIIQTCPDCTYNNITSILYPNGTRFLFTPQQNMTRAGTDYIFNTCDFSKLVGSYVVNGYGNLGGSTTTWNYGYKVNPTGYEQKSILNNAVFFILVVSSLILLGLGVVFSISTLGFIGSMLLVIGGVYTMIYGFNDVTNLYTQATAGILIVVGFVFMFAAAYEWFVWGAE